MVKRQAPLSTVPTRRFPIPELACVQLTLLIFSAKFDTANRDRRVVESFESEHRPNPLFDSPMVLFDEIVQVLARSNFSSSRKFAGVSR
jgi:hypothetical protein